MLIPVSATNQLADLRNLPVVAIDLGFSGSMASCGLAFRKSRGTEIELKNYQYNACIQKTAELIASNVNSVLILEAPLSAAFNSKGNPQSRGDFEGKPKPRWWSLGAGAVMSLAALYFLKELCQLVDKDTCCNLIEGFVTGEDSVDHAEVAKSLLNNFLNSKPTCWHQPKAPSIISILDWIEPSLRPHASPIVLMPVTR
jgi:hypothetical protein